MIRCEQCGGPATCWCRGPEAPALFFCHPCGLAHAVECPDLRTGRSRIDVLDRMTVADVARLFDVPEPLIDGAHVLSYERHQAAERRRILGHEGAREDV